MKEPNSIQHVPIEDLTLLEDNPRTITKDQFSKLLKSLKDDPDFFNLRPCLVNKIVEYPHIRPEDDGITYERKDTLTVYAGNQRVRAAKELGWKSVPCIIEDDIDEDVMNKRVILDNSSYGTWDWDALGNGYEVDLLIDCGFTENMLVGFETITEGETEPPKKDKKKKTCPECHHEW